MLGYPECSKDLVAPASLLYRYSVHFSYHLIHDNFIACYFFLCRVDDWTMGRERSYADYMKMVNISVMYSFNVFLPLNSMLSRSAWNHLKRKLPSTLGVTKESGLRSPKNTFIMDLRIK